MDDRRDTHTVVANMTLSGSPVLVGVYSHAAGESIYFKTEDNEEPIYLSVAEAFLFGAALQVAQDRIERQEA